MFNDIKVERIAGRKCPDCGHIIEWVAGKIDNSMQQYICKHCRHYITINGMTSEDQDVIAEEAFL